MTAYAPLNAVIFAALGLAVFFVACALAAKFAPFDIWKQLLEERNVAVAILAGAAILAIGWIVAAVMH